MRFGVWPSGKAAVFGIAIPGSNPGTPATLSSDFHKKNQKKADSLQPND